MARIRSVSPDLRISETCAAWDREVRYAWVLLWGYLDDYGIGLDNAKLIAADCFPLDDDVDSEVMEDWLRVFAEDGSICRYEHDGKRYLHALNWSEYQKPQHPGKRRLPPCPEHESAGHAEWTESHVRPSGKSHEGLVNVSPTRGRGSKEEEKEGEASRSAAAPPLYPDHCPAHSSVAIPGPCGNCADARKAYESGSRLPLALVRDTQRCLVHDLTFTTVCSGCRADEIASETA